MEIQLSTSHVLLSRREYMLYVDDDCGAWWVVVTMKKLYTLSISHAGFSRGNVSWLAWIITAQLRPTDPLFLFKFNLYTTEQIRCCEYEKLKLIQIIFPFIFIICPLICIYWCVWGEIPLFPVAVVVVNMWQKKKNKAKDGDWKSLATFIAFIQFGFDFSCWLVYVRTWKSGEVEERERGCV